MSFSFPVHDVSEINNILTGLKKKYHDARHHCYAYMLGSDHSQYRMNDDGEPSNSAGKPILGQIRSKQLTNVLVVVIRYFGGTLLGVGGLIQAYKSAAADALDNAEIVTMSVDDTYEIRYPYESVSMVSRILKKYKIRTLDQEYQTKVIMKISIRKNLAKQVIDQLKRIEGLDSKLVDLE